MKTKISVIKGDITTLDVEVIVNSANNNLMGGRGLDQAIHNAAGPKLLQECSGIGSCDTGDVKGTKAYELSANFILHAVGPVWRGGIRSEDLLLANCYEKCLKLGRTYKCKTIAFPNLCTGSYGFPKKRACNIAFSLINQYLLYHPEEYRVIYFVCFEDDNFQLYNKYLDILNGKMSKSS
jgi:O-acetyl-ADP-ribose deacetylase (regulator of RNase III)